MVWVLAFTDAMDGAEHGLSELDELGASLQQRGVPVLFAPPGLDLVAVGADTPAVDVADLREVHGSGWAVIREETILEVLPMGPTSTTLPALLAVLAALRAA